MWRLVGSIAVGTGVFGGLPWLMMREDGTGKMLWGMAVIAAAYWCSGCVRQVYVMGVSAYVKERVLLVRYGKQIPGWCSKAIKKVQKGIEKVYCSFDNIDFTDRNNKTILITNMSHDLKTPLTAIITYVDLLKLEKDEEKRKEYIQILEKKSLRLKVLIEDLFEISKATSQTVILNKMDVDVVNLFKQVKLELDSRFEEAELSFRCTWPEEKLICELDSQKTYRIFENLLVNISKYAMHGTRVYTKVCREDNEAVIQLLNVSAAEITVKAEDLTERFVRGDVSRNTEGSGLGLAIARSFTELQQGTFHLTIEGDMFKVEVRFPLKAVKNVDNSPEFA